MSSFVSNIMKLVSGSMIAQAFGILLFPIISRIYSPGDFGVFQLILSISSIIVIISSFSYHTSIVLPEKIEDSANIAVLCIFLIIISSSISGLVLIILSDQIASLLNAPNLSNYLILIPIFVFLNGLFVVLNYWLSRRIKFGVLARSRVVNSLSSKLAQIGIGTSTPSPIGLISGYLLGYLIANLLMLKHLKSDVQYFKNVSFKRMQILAIRYKRFPQFSLWSILANTISFQLAPFMLAYFFSSTTVGYYSFANQILVLPVSLIGAATSQVFFQKASDVKNKNGDLKKIVTEVHGRLISIGVFPMIAFMIISEDLFSFFLGNNWYTAGIYAKILAPWIFVRFIYSPISSVFDILEKQNVELYFNIMIIFSISVALYIGGSYGNPISALILLSGVGVLLWSSANFYILKLSEIQYINEIKIFIKYICIAILVSVPLIVVKYLYVSIYSILIVLGVITIIYYLIIVCEDVTLRGELYEIVKSVKK